MATRIVRQFRPARMPFDKSRLRLQSTRPGRQPWNERRPQNARNAVRLATARRHRRDPVAVRVALPQRAAPIAAATSRHPTKLAFSLMLVFLGVGIWASVLQGVGASRNPATPAAAGVSSPAPAPSDSPSATPQAPEPDTDVATGYRMPEGVRHAIEYAHQAVGVDAIYLVKVAARESGFNPAVRARTTTATGLYQFTASTWLRAVKFFGAQHGLEEFARQIAINENGRVIASHAARAKLLQLRKDPTLSALMAAELARDNKARLERLLGRGVTPAETYLAHFLGVSQAARIIDAAHSRPHVTGARLLPAAAQSNPAVFSPAGHAASAAAIVDKIEAYFDRDMQRPVGV